MPYEPMSEGEVIAKCLPAIVRWLNQHVGPLLACGCYAEKTTTEGGRVDGLVAALVEDDEGDLACEAVAIEAKSLKTIRQLCNSYRPEKGLVEAAAVGVTVGLLASGPLGWAAAAVTALVRREAHKRSDAALQVLRYPGDFKVLALPGEVFDEFPELIGPLREEAERHEFGLATVTTGGAFSWLVEPVRHEYSSLWGGDWIDKYVTGDDIRQELEDELPEDDE